MQHISALNNTAVRFLIDGFRVDEAERSLHQAMQWLSQVQQNPKQAPPSPQPATIKLQSSPVSVRRGSSTMRRSSASSFACAPSDFDDDDMDMEDHANSSFEDDDEQDEDDYEAPVQSIELTKVDPTVGCIHNILPLYNRALVLSYTAQYEEVAACVLFNLALIYHIRGMTVLLASQRSDNLQKALKLYELAVKILQRQTPATVGAEQQQERLVDELLVLALFYNLGHASAQLFSNSQAAAYFGFLRQVLRQNTACHGTDALQDEDQSFFFFNAMLFQGEQMTLAPAA
ncbi:expressed unknown protein [Seminavis robusta]|uniref:Uncharacterized protein n=1 Tax=Seminavis robusta TaxID=568900 RepID=A0A9N8EPJ6_9STRA|nr:expressed unknown protein [Seminavis robusta]|eukprot:Sro1343_g264650.1 n/a (288) ;mRNA; r:21439-22302